MQNCKLNYKTLHPKLKVPIELDSRLKSAQFNAVGARLYQ